MKYRIDQGDPETRIALALCACGQRFLALDRTAALDRLANHEKIHHPTDKHARAGLAQARRAEDTRKK